MLKSALWVVGLLLFSVGVLLGYNRFMMARNVEFLFQQVLGEGDLDAAYRNGDPSFQMVYSREAFRQVVCERPELLQRDRVVGREVVWRKGKNELYVVVKAEVDGAGGNSPVDYYCRPAGVNQWRLVGIDPGLDAAIPKALSVANR